MRILPRDTTLSTPAQVATIVCDELECQKLACPPHGAIKALFELMYFASMRTEEGRPITFHTIYMDPSNPDPQPPKRIVKDRWSVVRFESPIPATLSALIKLANASDPRTSSLAVYHVNNGNALHVWGLVDQGNTYHEFINYEGDTGPERPGLFQASITGVGQLAAYRGYQRLVELEIDAIRPPALDVLNRGPIHLSAARR